MLETQYEKNLVVNNRELNYKGIFRADELFSVINRAIEDRAYEKREKKTEELVTDSGRQTYVELRPFKEMSDYVTLMIKIKISLNNVTETVEEFQDEKKKFQKGDVQLVFDAWSLTDYENRWGMKPWVFFMKGVINKLIYTFPLESGFTSDLVYDTAYIYAKVKKFLNLYQSGLGNIVSEEAIRKDVEKEISEELKKNKKIDNKKKN